jgi:uncharacterized membrane protein
MSNRQEDANNVKKSILMRYPISFLEEVSRALIGYKSYRDLKQYYRALPVLDTLLDYVTIDPKTRRRVYEMTEQERRESPHHFIDMDSELVNDFREYYYGPRKDGQLALKLLSPGESVDQKRGIVVVRKPINFLEAWGRYDPDYIISVGGFYYNRTEYKATPYGMLPYTIRVPMINFADPDIIHHETDTIPYSYWTEMYDLGWEKISVVCTIIEKIIARTLEDAGYTGPNATVTSKAKNDGHSEADRKDRLKL